MKKAAKEIKSIEPCALHLHCFGHSLNLAVADTLKSIKIVSDILDHALDICKLLKFSLRRNAIFQKAKVRAASLENIRNIYEALEGIWEEALSVVARV